MLSDASIRAARPRDKPYKLFDKQEAQGRTLPPAFTGS